MNLVSRALSWLGNHEFGLLATLFFLATGIWGFAALATEVKDGDTTGFDKRVLLSMRHPGDLSPKGSRAFQEAARDITALGGVSVLGLVTFTAVVFLVLDGKSRMAAYAAVSVVGGTLLAQLLKDIFQRPRPDIVPHLAYAASSSFPSGHSMMSSVTYLTLAALLARSHERRRIKAFVLLIATLVIGMVGFTRVYLGVHWPTDVLAGWMAGALWAMLCWLGARWLQNRQTLEPAAEHTAIGN
ncbi:MAG: phosphatase PAP2 family protein [Acidobacteriota bacterium]|nr:phosphatase PAP2 family protein [Acidobacteriota bacterium]